MLGDRKETGAGIRGIAPGTERFQTAGVDNRSTVPTGCRNPQVWVNDARLPHAHGLNPLEIKWHTVFGRTSRIAWKVAVDARRTVEVRQIAPVALGRAGHPARGVVGHHPPYQVVQSLPEVGVDRGGGDVLVRAVFVHQATIERLPFPGRAGNQWKRVHVDHHLRDVRVPLCAGLYVVHRGLPVGRNRNQIGLSGYQRS